MEGAAREKRSWAEMWPPGLRQHRPGQREGSLRESHTKSPWRDSLFLCSPLGALQAFTVGNTVSKQDQPRDTKGQGPWWLWESDWARLHGLHTYVCSWLPLFMVALLYGPASKLLGASSCLPSFLPLTPHILVVLSKHPWSYSGHHPCCPLSLVALVPDLPLPGSGQSSPLQRGFSWP